MMIFFIMKISSSQWRAKEETFSFNRFYIPSQNYSLILSLVHHLNALEYQAINFVLTFEPEVVKTIEQFFTKHNFKLILSKIV